MSVPEAEEILEMWKDTDPSTLTEVQQKILSLAKSTIADWRGIY